ncbi:hypothetical protein G9A89_003665 [Geosiphon pyriformis]|nr:hypothetical protein G9A89_003665 [Geosiphon pyriformis]
MQELQLSQNDQHTWAPAKAYQVLWADVNHNKLLPILSWNDKEKKKEEEKLIWGTNQRFWSDYSQSKPTTEWTWEEKRKGKEQEKEPAQFTTPTYATYRQPKLVCITCGKKLLAIGTCCDNDKNWQTATRYYCCPCIIECDGQPSKHAEKHFWIKECGITFQDEKKHAMKHATLKHLEDYLHDEHEIWRMAYAMAERAIASELRKIKTNLLSLSKPEYVATFDIFASTREEQEEQLAQLNTRLCNHCLIPCDF